MTKADYVNEKDYPVVEYSKILSKKEFISVNKRIYKDIVVKHIFSNFPAKKLNPIRNPLYINGFGEDHK